MKNYLGENSIKKLLALIKGELDTKAPLTRKINGKTLDTDITLSALDVGALPDTTEIPSIEGLATEEFVNEQIAGINIPVQSVNGKTGKISLTASDVGALPDNTVIPSVDDLTTVEIYTVNLSMDGWTENEGYASQTITVSGILASDNPIVDINAAGLTAIGMQAIASAWCEVYHISTAANSITVYSRSVPTTDIPIKLMVVR